MLDDDTKNGDGDDEEDDDDDDDMKPMGIEEFRARVMGTKWQTDYDYYNVS